jgi:hypothetical protein
MKQRPASAWKLAILAVVVAAALGLAVTVAFGRSAAAPANTSLPTISGTARDGESLTAKPGSWTGSPTQFAYQWRHCASDGTACGTIVGATKETYAVAAADVSHTLRVQVTASNAEGRDTAMSDPTDVVDSKDGPKVSVRPTVSGSARVGEELTVSNGTWSPTPTSFRRQWQRCETSGDNCRNIPGATGRSYGVRSADIGRRLCALVTAITSTNGVATTASSLSGEVAGNTSTTTVPGNRQPSVRFVSLKWFGSQLYARVRVCDDDTGRIGLTIRHDKARALPYTRRFAVTLTSSCGSYLRHWRPPSRFRTTGTVVLQLRASDSSRALSRVARRAIRHS